MKIKEVDGRWYVMNENGTHVKEPTALDSSVLAIVGYNSKSSAENYIKEHS